MRRGTARGEEKRQKGGGRVTHLQQKPAGCMTDQTRGSTEKHTQLSFLLLILHLRRQKRKIFRFYNQATDYSADSIFIFIVVFNVYWSEKIMIVMHIHCLVYKM